MLVRKLFTAAAVATLCTSALAAQAVPTGEPVFIDGFEHGSVEHWSSNPGYNCPVFRTPAFAEEGLLFDVQLVQYLGTLDIGFATPNPSQMAVQIWPDFGGPIEPDLIDLTTDGNDDYSICGTCVLLVVDYAGGPLSDSQVLFQRAGTLDITALDLTVGEPFAATIEATLEEVTIDPKTAESTPVPGGCVAPIHGYSFSVTLEELK